MPAQCVGMHEHGCPCVLRWGGGPRGPDGGLDRAGDRWGKPEPRHVALATRGCSETSDQEKRLSTAFCLCCWGPGPWGLTPPLQAGCPLGPCRRPVLGEAWELSLWLTLPLWGRRSEGGAAPGPCTPQSSCLRCPLRTQSQTWVHPREEGRPQRSACQKAVSLGGHSFPLSCDTTRRLWLG